MGVVVNRFDIYRVNLDPTMGSEIKKSRPCIIISPEEMNKYLHTVIIAPMTTVVRSYPSRVGCKFKGKNGEIALDQLRAIDKQRLVKRLGRIKENVQNTILSKLEEMFSA